MYLAWIRLDKVRSLRGLSKQNLWFCWFIISFYLWGCFHWHLLAGWRKNNSTDLDKIWSKGRTWAAKDFDGNVDHVTLGFWVALEAPCHCNILREDGLHVVSFILDRWWLNHRALSGLGRIMHSTECYSNPKVNW